LFSICSVGWLLRHRKMKRAISSFLEGCEDSRFVVLQATPGDWTEKRSQQQSARWKGETCGLEANEENTRLGRWWTSRSFTNFQYSSILLQMFSLCPNSSVPFQDIDLVCISWNISCSRTNISLNMFVIWWIFWIFLWIFLFFVEDRMNILDILMKVRDISLNIFVFCWGLDEYFGYFDEGQRYFFEYFCFLLRTGWIFWIFWWRSEIFLWIFLFFVEDWMNILDILMKVGDISLNIFVFLLRTGWIFWIFQWRSEIFLWIFLFFVEDWMNILDILMKVGDISLNIFVFRWGYFDFSCNKVSISLNITLTTESKEGYLFVLQYKISS